MNESMPCRYCGAIGYHRWAGAGACPGLKRERELSPEEAVYLLGFIKAHLDYYRLLAGNGKCTSASRAKLLFLEALVAKLAQTLRAADVEMEKM